MKDIRLSIDFIQNFRLSCDIKKEYELFLGAHAFELPVICLKTVRSCLKEINVDFHKAFGIHCQKLS